METKTINIVAGVAVVFAVIFGVAYLKPTAITNVVNVPEPRVDERDFGAIPGTDVGPLFCIGGICEYRQSGAFGSSGSSPIVSFLNPFGATSTAAISLTQTGTSTSAITYYAGTTTLPSVAAGYKDGLP